MFSVQTKPSLPEDQFFKDKKPKKDFFKLPQRNQQSEALLYQHRSREESGREQIMRLEILILNILREIMYPIHRILRKGNENHSREHDHHNYCLYDKYC